MSLELDRLRGLLFDLDGVLFVGDDVVPGAVEGIRALAGTGLVMRFITNTTATPRAVLLDKLRGLGIPVESEQLFTPAALARRHMQRSGRTRYRLVGAPALAADLGPGLVEQDDPSTPDWVIMGLHQPSFQHEVLRIAFQDIHNGARLLALHRNRMWRTARGLEPGLGAYVAALEYAADVKATVIGKPSAEFFREVVDDTGLPASSLAMVGDDVDADIGGAQAIGMGGVLVRTGKFTIRALARSRVEPDLIVDDVGALARAFLDLEE